MNFKYILHDNLFAIESNNIVIFHIQVQSNSCIEMSFKYLLHDNLLAIESNNIVIFYIQVQMQFLQ